MVDLYFPHSMIPQIQNIHSIKCGTYKFNHTVFIQNFQFLYYITRLVASSVRKYYLLNLNFRQRTGCAANRINLRQIATQKDWIQMSTRCDLKKDFARPPEKKNGFVQNLSHFLPLLQLCSHHKHVVWTLQTLLFLLLKAKGDTTFLDRIHFGCQANKDIFYPPHWEGIVRTVVATPLLSSLDSTCLYDCVCTVCVHALMQSFLLMITLWLKAMDTQTKTTLDFIFHYQIKPRWSDLMERLFYF